MSGLASRLEAIWYGGSRPPWVFRALASLYAFALRRRRPFNAERLPAPCLGFVPRLAKATPAAVAAHLDLALLDPAL